jgi:LCP family protein required for cell wall assembly
MKKIILTIIAFLFLAVVGFGSYAFYKVNQTVNTIQQNTGFTAENTGDAATNATESVNYLLLGTDTGELGRDYKGRTDTMIVLSVNPEKKQAQMTSIPRDTLISYEGNPIKINAAYAYGSATSAVEAVQNLLNIQINGYALINMGGLEKMVDAVGGVEVTSPLSFTYEGKAFVKDQTYHLNGTDALKFSRMRKEDPQGDYGRQQRQQLVIQGILSQAQQPGTLFNDKLLTSIAENVRTDISLNSMKNLALKYRPAMQNMTQDQLKGQTQMIAGQSFEVIADSEIQRVHNKIETLVKN